MNTFDYATFISGYREFDRHTWNKLQPLYHSDAVFIDPVHSLRGHTAIAEYFNGMAGGLLHCRFDLDEPIAGQDSAVISWRMTFAHKRLKRGQTIEVEGITVLQLAEGLIVSHRDYYDLGQMLYQNIPLLGRIIMWLNRRLAGPGSSREQADEARSVASGPLAQGAVRGK